MEDKRISVLGTTYTIKYGNCKDHEQLGEIDGYTDNSTHTIVVDDMTLALGEIGSKGNLDEYRKEVTRHEIIHAFLSESGLRENSSTAQSWATNEEMVDWIALQFPKILKAFEEAECI